jgi:hypothetical protein
LVITGMTGETKASTSRPAGPRLFWK